MDLHEVRAAIAAALTAHTPLTGVPIIQDDGTKGKEQEAALATAGIVLVVSPALAVRMSDAVRSGKSSQAVGVIAVHVRSQPLVNFGTGGKALDPQLALVEVMRAVVIGTRHATTGVSSIQPAKDYAAVVEDSGLLTYSAMFDAAVMISA